MRTSVLIPAKGFAYAKQRLAQDISPFDREVLAESMLRHVLEQVGSARGIESTYVVTASDEVIRLALSRGARVIREKSERGETEAVTFAVAEMKRNGVQSVLILPGDLPLLRAADVEALVHRVPEVTASVPFALLTPSRDRMGTNALLLSPPDAITPRFGFDSFCHHLSEAAAKRLHITVLENERIALDVDYLQDLEACRSSNADHPFAKAPSERSVVP
ncbi:MAG: 2-phospho-L-lactate guanylyltransferase [Deltaproteobacteria bacterium]|nr:2-phospho-L-lactate guanylyltransferase [Deltaproteobacteria bacterium]